MVSRNASLNKYSVNSNNRAVGIEVAVAVRGIRAVRAVGALGIRALGVDVGEYPKNIKTVQGVPKRIRVI